MATIKDEVSPDVQKKILIRLYTIMLKIRKAQEKIAEIFPQEPRRIKCPVHLCTGQEAIAAGICVNLLPEDYVFSYYRGHGHYLAKGGDMKKLFAELYGKETGCSKGRGGSMHLVDVENGFMGTSAIVGGAIPLAVGAALAFKMRQESRIAVCFFGDGACEEGVLHESMNFAALKKLPILFVCENNFYAVKSNLFQRQALDNIFQRSFNYGIPGLRINGNDVLNLFGFAEEMIKKIREESFPSFIEARTYRWRGHVENSFDKDSFEGRPAGEVRTWMNRCPIKIHENFLLRAGILSRLDIQKINAEIDWDIEEAIQFAEESPFPDAGKPDAGKEE